jgi:hypothetical protein
MAALMLRERVTHLWAALPVETKRALKNVVLSLVAVEVVPAVRDALSRVTGCVMWCGVVWCGYGVHVSF